jgi:hypothetical protein
VSVTVWCSFPLQLLMNPTPRRAPFLFLRLHDVGPPSSSIIVIITCLSLEEDGVQHPPPSPSLLARFMNAQPPSNSFTMVPVSKKEAVEDRLLDDGAE